jgi:hypothetical protein
MGFDHSTYAFVGVHVPSDQYEGHASEEAERLDVVINNDPRLKELGVGHIYAGDYDRDELFLCWVPEGTGCEVQLGEWKAFEQQIPMKAFLALMHLGVAAGYTGLAEPAFLVVPDMS